MKDKIHIDYDDIDKKEDLEIPLDRLMGQLMKTIFEDLKVVKLLKEFTDGKSSTRVFLAQIIESTKAIHQAHIIIKVGRSTDLRNEINNYLSIERYVMNLAAFVKILIPRETHNILPDDSSPGAIAYTYAVEQFSGAESCSISIGEFCRKYLVQKPVQFEEGSEKTDEIVVKWEHVEKVLNISFHALQSLFRTPETEHAYKIADYYLDRWVPNLKVHALSYQQNEKTHLITDYEDGNKEEIKELLPHEMIRYSENRQGNGKYVKISNLSCIGFRDNIVRLGITISNLIIEVDLTELTDDDKKQVINAEENSIELRTHSENIRYNFYWKRLDEVFPPMDFDPPEFYVGPIRVKNPLSDLSKPWDDKYIDISTEMGPAHGDLHTGNVIVVNNFPVFIDYGLAEAYAPMGVDMVRLFGGIIRDIIAPEIEFEQLKMLLQMVFFDRHSSEPIDAMLERACKLLKLFWELLGHHIDRPLCWLHLYGYAWIGLKWNDASNINSYRACFLIACLACTNIMESFDKKVYELRA